MKTKIISVIIGLVFIGFSALIGVNYVKGTKEVSYYRTNGGTAQATVTAAENYQVREQASVGKTHGKRNYETVNYSDFTISYSVNGTNYTYEFEKINGIYTKGSKIPVYYLNDDPGQIRLDIEAPSAGVLIFGGMLLLIGVIVAVRGITKKQIIQKDEFEL